MRGTVFSGLDRSQESGVYPIRQEIQLTPNQMGSFFFTQFNFTLSYLPRSKNIKPDALSHVFSSNPNKPTSILPSFCAIIGGIKSGVRQAAGKETTPDGCPPNGLYVPTHNELHTGCFTCSPGVTRTMFIIRQRFWWSRMERKV